MKLKKRTKRSRLHGSKTAFHGGRKRQKGKGHRGGIGLAGTGKRADQKKSKILNENKNYFGKKGFKILKKAKKTKSINLKTVNDNIVRYMQQGIAVKNSKGVEIKLKNYKILSTGDVKEKYIIHCNSASKKAVEKVKKAGGEIIFSKKPDEEVTKKEEQENNQ